MRLDRRRLLLGASAGLVVAGGALGVLWALQPRGSVRIGTSFAGPAVEDEPSFRPDQPVRALLALDGPLGFDGSVDVAVQTLGTGEDRPFKTLATRGDAKNDELIFAAPDAEGLVNGRRGRFRLAFMHEGEVLGAATFSVVDGPPPK